MYTNEQKMKAVELYIKYNHRATQVSRELGYPHPNFIARWYKEYLQNGTFRTKYERQNKYTEEQKQYALQYYQEHGCCATQTMRDLGYPSPFILRKWINEAYPDRKKYCASGGKMIKCSQEKKEKAVIDLCARNGSAQEVAKNHGVSREVLYKWEKQILRLSGSKTMSEKKQAKPKIENISVEELLAQLASLKEEVEAQELKRDQLQQEVYRLQVERDIIEAASIVLKKEKGVNLEQFSNREKAEVINALRNKYQLNVLLEALKIAKSSYCYQNHILHSPDKYQSLRESVKKEFTQGYQSYGYRRIYSALKRQGIVISEKVIRRIMRQENLNVICKRKKKYNSYVGEISPAVPNLVQRNFHADKPNQVWLTDITEFNIPAGKVYLSPVIDCFDGLPVAWTIGVSPNAELVNTMLDDAIQTLNPDEHPIVHSDRGGHYRWPGWIERMEKAGLIRSMSKKGCSPDNSACEGFFGRLKNEMFYNRSWADVSVESFIDEVNRYLIWYCNQRIKLSLGSLSPIEYRRKLGYSI